MQDVSKPKAPPERDRLVTADELERLSMFAGDDLTSATARTFHAFLFSCETAMRAGEVGGLVWARMVGHRDLEMLLTYFNESKESLAKTLDERGSLICRALRTRPSPPRRCGWRYRGR